MRFDYDPPSKMLLVAPGDWRLIFYDGSIQQVNVIPIGETPLGFLLSEEVKLAGDVTVAGGRRSGPARSTSRWSAPTSPTRARWCSRWPRTRCGSAAGRSPTRRASPRSSSSTDLQTGMPLDRELFVWRDPKMFGWPKD